jgi:hypothetical protein
MHDGKPSQQEDENIFPFGKGVASTRADATPFIREIFLGEFYRRIK